jgi:hypothetical protein
MLRVFIAHKKNLAKDLEIFAKLIHSSSIVGSILKTTLNK